MRALAPLVLCLAIVAVPDAFAQDAAADPPHDHAMTCAEHCDGMHDPDAAPRFATDTTLREQMAGIRAAVGELAHLELGHMGTAQARVFAEAIETRVQTIIAECQLPPDADAALHAIIVPLLNAALALKANPADAAPVATMRAALADYALRFDDPGTPEAK